MGGEGSLIFIIVFGGAWNLFLLNKAGMTYFGGIFHPFHSHPLPLQVIISQSLYNKRICILMCLYS